MFSLTKGLVSTTVDQGANQVSVSTHDDEGNNILGKILKELRILNLHQAIANDVVIDKTEVET